MHMTLTLDTGKADRRPIRGRYEAFSDDRSSVAVGGKGRYTR